MTSKHASLLVFLCLTSSLVYANSFKVRASIDPFTDEPNAVLLLHSINNTASLFHYCAHEKVHSVIVDHSKLPLDKQIHVEENIDGGVVNRLVGSGAEGANRAYLLDDEVLLADEMMDGNWMVLRVDGRDNMYTQHTFSLAGVRAAIREVLTTCQK